VIRFPRTGRFSCIQSAEVYPLVLSIGIVIQSIIFVAVQAQGLKDFSTKGCTLLVLAMLPALFIAAVIQLFFGLETTWRGIQKKPFEPRGRWNVTIVLVFVGMALLAAFLVADFIRSRDECFGSLFWFVVEYADIIWAVFAAIAVLLIACAVTIFLRLSRNAKIEPGERVAASRMVFFLALAVISIVSLDPALHTTR
jgi:hypothetical protein